MRIQHNITAMNSYRNFSANTSNLSKNLEKLSSGYKINRAGDDAAGLAISEKMRAQITGIEGATKNSKDGISLIQTAEGALTEVHDMLNRMTTLAEQSANGTYQNELDREQLQKEVSQLKEEIDRIADSTNFNGLKLLDGSLSGAGNLDGNVQLTTVAATSSVAKTSDLATLAASGAKGDTFSYTVSWKDGDEQRSRTVKFTVGSTVTEWFAEDGAKYTMSAAKATKAELLNAIRDEINKDSTLSTLFEAAASGSALKLTSKNKSADAPTVAAVEFKKTTAAGTNSYISGGGVLATNVEGTDESQKLGITNIKVLNDTATEKTISENIFTIGGERFVLYAATKANDLNKLKDNIDNDVNVIQLDGGNKSAANVAYTAGATDAKTIAGELKRITGMNFSASGTDVILSGSTKLSKSGKSLDLQIGDTADSFNKLSVTVNDMHAKAIGIGDVDISTQEGAAAALDKIKTAINNVSDTRGTLGSLQNRLEHTINNLGVQRENIQNAESLIRDTDVAEEMMTYTKNNILNQSAQAMLAQANQLPQGVLQLLG